MKRHQDHEIHEAWRAAHYKDADRNDKLIINLRDLSHTMRFLYEGKGSQKCILIVLNEMGRTTQRELTERLGIQPGSASEVIAKLEIAGLITRTMSETDRRTMNIELTEEGKKLACEAVEQRNRRHEEMFSCLSEEDKDLLLSLLEKMNADWQTRYQGNMENRDHSEHCHGRHMHHRGERH